MLTALGIVLGSLSLGFGMAHYFGVRGVPSVDILLASWIIALAIVVPVDAAGLLEERMLILFLSALTPWAFVVAYPAYLFIRPRTGRYRAYLAIVSIVLTLVGFILWDSGENPAAFRVHGPVQDGVNVVVACHNGAKVPFAEAGRSPSGGI
jgi:hypothetical protein